MLGGTSPLFLFRLGELPSTVLSETDVFKDFSAVRDELSQFAENFGIPIPIYLDEKITQICVDNETRNIDLETDVLTRDYGAAGGPKIRQKGVNTSVTVNLEADRSSIVMTTLLALLDVIFPRINTMAYSISYFNGATVVLDGLLHGVATSVSRENSLIRTSITISRAAERKAPPKGPIPVERQTGALPSGVT